MSRFFFPAASARLGRRFALDLGAAALGIFSSSTAAALCEEGQAGGKSINFFREGAKGNRTWFPDIIITPTTVCDHCSYEEGPGLCPF